MHLNAVCVCVCSFNGHRSRRPALRAEHTIISAPVRCAAPRFSRPFLNTRVATALKNARCFLLIKHLSNARARASASTLKKLNINQHGQNSNIFIWPVRAHALNDHNARAGDVSIHIVLPIYAYFIWVYRVCLCAAQQIWAQACAHLRLIATIMQMTVRLGGCCC